MSRAELIGYAAAVCVFVTFYMKTMVPLRIAGIVSNALFIAYAYDLLAYPVLILHIVLLPLNIIRLRQMLNLIRQIEIATKDDGNLDWVKPFSSVQDVSAGVAPVPWKSCQTSACAFKNVRGSTGTAKGHSL